MCAASLPSMSRSSVVPLGTCAKLPVVRCRITPLLPTAQTSFGPEPQTRRSEVVTGLGSAVEVSAGPVDALPATPTPQMSFGAAPHTSYMKSIPFGVAVAVQRVPS